MRLLYFPWGAILPTCVLSVGTVIIGHFVSVGYSKWASKSTTKTILSMFKKGSQRAPESFTMLHTIPELDHLVAPTELWYTYAVVYGEKGIGKTTLLQQLTFKKPNVILVSLMSPEHNTAKELADAIGLSLEESGVINQVLGRKDSPMKDLKRVFDALDNAAYVFKNENKKPLVLVIDNINLLSPVELLELQAYAKRHADYGDLIIIFVASEGWAPTAMCMRAGVDGRMRVIRVGDLDANVAARFVQSISPSTSTADCQQIVATVGGRASTLMRAAQDVKHGKTVLDIGNRATQDARSAFATVGTITPPQPLTTSAVWQAASAIVQAPTKSIPLAQFQGYFNSPAESQQVLARNVFALHESEGLVVMQSQVTYVYACTCLNIVPQPP